MSRPADARILSLSILLGVALVLPTGAQAWEPSSASEIALGTEGITADPAAAYSFRLEAGLPDDPATIKASYIDSLTYDDGSFGVPLTDSEAATVRMQILEQAALASTTEAAADLPGFATEYFEGSVLHVLVKGPLNEPADSLSRTQPAGSKVQIETADRDRSELLATQAAIVKDSSELEGLGIALIKVGINPKTARVEVTIGASKDAVVAQDILLSRYGQGIELQTDGSQGSLLACTSRNDCGTKGGLGATHPSNGVTCSTAFVVKDRTTSARYLMTAGHCIVLSGGDSNPNPWANPAGTLTWGTNVRHAFDINFDVGIFRLGTTLPSSYDQYFATGPSDILIVNYPEMSWASMTVGLWVCRSAKISGWGCATIHRADIDWKDGGGDWHWDVWEVSHVSTHGDSGAGYVALATEPYAKPAGILFGGDEGLFAKYTYYYPASDDWAINVHTCTTSAC